MPRALSRAVGILLSLGVVVGAASAQAPSESPSRAESARKDAPSSEDTLTEAHFRLEEMKVDLALMSDPGVFPFYVGACAVEGEIELRGNVPSEKVRERALDVARRGTYLNVRSALKIEPLRNPLPPLRSTQVLQQEASELLVQHLGAARGKIGLQVRYNGQIALTGPIDSMETKVAVSRMFRQLPGCYGVLNDLTVPESLREGRLVVPLTRGSLTAPASALQQKNHPIPPPPVTTTKANQETATPSTRHADATPLPTHLGSEERQSVSALPSAMPVGPPTMSSESSVAKNPRGADALTTPAVPKNWTKPAMTWESDTKPLPPSRPAVSTDAPERAVTTAQAAPSNPLPRQGIDNSNAAPVQPNASSVRSARRWPPAFEAKAQPVNEPLSAVKIEAEMMRAKAATPAPARSPVVNPEPVSVKPLPQGPVHVTVVKSDPEPVKPIPQPPMNAIPSVPFVKAEPVSPKPTSPAKETSPAPLATAKAQTGIIEFEEERPPVKVASPTAATGASGVIEFEAERPQAQADPWKSAKGQTGSIEFEEEKTDAKPPAKPSNGQAGYVLFEDGSKPKPMPIPRATAFPWIPEELQRHIKDLCGRHAAEVMVEGRPDGSLQVRVKVRTAVDEKVVTGKILAIPGMGSPQVHLLVDLGP